MKKILALAGLATAGLAAIAQALPPPEIAAREYVLIDMNAGQTLAERGADAPSDPASLTKLMTAYLVFVALHDHRIALAQKMPVSTRAWAERKGGGSLMFVDTTMTPTVDDLLQGLIVDSGNDAAVALAEAVGGGVDAYVAMMNRQARAWGLKNTTFRNVTGLTEPGHRSTPRDMTAIAMHIIRDFPEYYHYYAQRDYTFADIRQDNRNLLLKRDPSVDGMKTGFTDAAGYCLLASAQREFPNGKRRLDRDRDGRRLDPGPRERDAEAVELGFHGVRRRAPGRGRQGGRDGAGVEGPVAAGGNRQRRGDLRRGAQGRRRAPEDDHRTHRPVGRAAGPEPARRFAPGRDRVRRADRHDPVDGAATGARRGPVRARLGCDPTLDQVISGAAPPDAARIVACPGASIMTALPDSLCYLDGDFLPLNQARVSVMDRGFLFGDGAYESIPVYGRRLFRVDDHLARLERSLGKIGIETDFDRDTWLARIRRVVAGGPTGEQMVHIQVTRGVAPRSHIAPAGLEPTVFVTTSERTEPTPAQRVQGLACISARDFRWQRGDIKSTSLLGNVLARKISADQGADETILLRDGGAAGPWLTEGASSNVWVVHEGALLGPAPDEHLLQGVRVELLRELCEETGIAFNLRPVSEADVRGADELLLSSASQEIIAVTRLDGEDVGHGALRGRPGPVYASLHEAYQRAIQSQSI